MFKTADVEQVLLDHQGENLHLANDDEGAILNWVQGHDELITEPSDVPSNWSRFQFLANDLVRADKAEIYCRKCNATIESHRITTNMIVADPDRI